MKHKTSQSGFTLIELIAVMVILGILAAVIIPRISTLTSGAYESNVRSMYGVIKNEVNAQAVKAAMSGGASGHMETYPVISVAADNYYLVAWVEDYEGDYWHQEQTGAGDDAGGHTNGHYYNSTHNEQGAVFYYMPHGLGSAQVNSITSAEGTSTNLEDIYFILYAPTTTTDGKAGGRNYDGFLLNAYSNKLMDQAWGTKDTETEITDMQWETPPQ